MSSSNSSSSNKNLVGTATVVSNAVSSNTYFESKKQAALQQIDKEFKLVLLNLESLNSVLNDSITLAHQFDNISTLWNTFYSSKLQKELLKPEHEDKDGDEDVEIHKEGGNSINDGFSS